MRRETAAAAAMTAPRPSLPALWRALAAVPDPEIPVVSVVELGIVRGVDWDAADPATLVVRVTPTYSGCPATELIMTASATRSPRSASRACALETQLSPPWTTDWITAGSAAQAARLRHRAADGRGGAATATSPRGRRRRHQPAAPRAASSCRARAAGRRETQLRPQFGSTACKAQYRCLDCLEPFDYFKPHLTQRPYAHLSRCVRGDST